MEMAACNGAPDTPAEPTVSTLSPTIETLLCDHCRCPIASVWDVLPAEENAPAWRDHVYSYELDLFNNGAPPIQAYSATNPSKRRFDLLRLAPHVTVPHILDNTVHRIDNNPQPEAQLPGTQTSSAEGAAVKEEAETSMVTPSTQRAAPFVECDTTEYSSEHSFFVGYAWCFCHCSNCGAFLGWGFASEERLRAAARTRARDEPHNVTGHSLDDACAETERHNSPSRRRLDNVENAGLHADTTASTLATATASTHPADETNTGGGEESTPAPPEDVEGNAPRTREESSSSTTTTITSSSTQSGATSNDGGVKRVAGVSPDFIGIIITHCTGEPKYPVASLVQETAWRPWRLRRRQRMERVIRQLRRVLLEMEDGYRAHQLYYVCESLVAQAYQTAPPQRTQTTTSAGPHGNTNNSDHHAEEEEEEEENVEADDGVPQHLLSILQLARAALEQQRGGHDYEESSDEREDGDDNDDDDDDEEAGSGDNESEETEDERSNISREEFI